MRWLLGPLLCAVATVLVLAFDAEGPAVSSAPRSTLPVAVQPDEAQHVSSATSPRPSATWVAETASRTSVPEPAIRAYGAAALRLAQEQPGCRLGWTTLAGIGHIETGHGQGGLDEHGRTADLVLGPELDGQNGHAAIAGDDATWDQARGPMQFIASTWRTWAADGDGDGIADVDDVDDAALAAARYLCAAGGDLSTGAGWTRAVFAYNHSDAYVASVLAAANSYALA